jgi:large subunit ribosomal protein L31
MFFIVFSLKVVSVDEYTLNLYNSPDMKKDLHHKDYRLVVFEDLNDGTKILTRSTVATEETTKWEDGNDYPLVKVHISSSSHPFFTGQEKLVDIEGRVDRFKARTEAAKAAREAKVAKKPRKNADAPVKLGATPTPKA